jgi:hypothetical protein
MVYKNVGPVLSLIGRQDAKPLPTEAYRGIYIQGCDGVLERTGLIGGCCCSFLCSFLMLLLMMMLF